MRLKGKKPIFTRKDCWSLDDTLGPIIAAGLSKFKDELIRLRDEDNRFRGFPSSIMNLAQQSITDERHEELYQQWIDTVGKMVYAFENKEPWYTGGFTYNKDGDTIMATYTPNDPEAYELNKLQCEEHHAKVKEGLELFAKHYYDLWW